MSEKYLINCADGRDNPEKATIAFILAFTASKDGETAVFVTAGGADLCVKGGTTGVQATGYEPVATLLDGFLANGGRIWLCPACAKARGISQNDLVDGVEIAGAPRTMAFLAAGARTLM